MAPHRRARLVFTVGGTWRGVGGDRSTAALSGVVEEKGTDRRLPAEGTLTVRPGRVVHVELHLRFGEGRIHVARSVELVPTSLDGVLDTTGQLLDGVVGTAGQLLGQVLHQEFAPIQVSLPGTLEGGALHPEDVDVSIDLTRLLRVALRAVR